MSKDQPQLARPKLITTEGNEGLALRCVHMPAVLPAIPVARIIR